MNDQVLAALEGEIIEPPKQVEVPTPQAVERMCSALQKVWMETAANCRSRAHALRLVADELDARAANLEGSVDQFPDELKEIVRFEIMSRHRVNSLVGVEPAN